MPKPKSSPTTIPGYYTRDEAAAALDIEPQGVAHHVNAGRLTPVMVGRSPLFPRGEVDALAAEKKAGNLKPGPKKST